MDVIDSLAKLNFPSKSAEAYLALLRLQEANPHQIAKEAGIERTTIYKVMEDLVKKGLATESTKGKRILYIAESPLELKHFIQKQNIVLDQILPMLLALRGKKSTKPTVRFYSTSDGIKKVFMDSTRAQEKLRRDFVAIETMIPVLGKRFIQKEINERVKRRIKVRSLRCKFKGSTETEEGDWFLRKDSPELLRKVRHLDKSIQFEPFIMIYDNVVAVISSAKESYALVIESRELSQTMKAFFDIVWKTAK